MFRDLVVIGFTMIVGFAVPPQAVQGEPPGASGGKVQAEVYAALEKSAEKTVLVEVTLTPLGEEMAVMPEGWSLIAGRQDGVLARMEPGEFEVMYRPHRPAIMVGRANAAGLAKLAADPDVVAVGPGKITSIVYTELEKSDDGTALVCVILKAADQALGKEKSSRAKSKAAIKQAQDKTLVRLDPEGFKLVWRFETAAMLVGHINAAGLTKLAAAPDVVMVRPSKTDHKVFTQLEDSQDGTIDVIVNLKHVSKRKWEGNRSQRRLILEENKLKVKVIQDRVLSVFEPGEFRIVYEYSPSPGFAGYVNAAGLAKLEAHPDVTGVGANLRLRGQLLESVPFIYADDVHDQLGYTGAGITVAVLDTGIDENNPDVQGDVAPGGCHFLFFAGGGIGPGAPDGNGHGTAMAAIITSPIGVAPDAKILPIKTFDDNKDGTLGDLIVGIRYVTNHQLDYPNLCVINMSLGTQMLYAACPCNDVDDSTRTLAAVLNDAKACGIVAFAATGNDAMCGGITAPACISSAVPVAAVYDGSYGIVNYSGICSDPSAQPHHVACFSNLMNNCDTLAAPGYNITAGPLTDKWGTSLATAYCSGVAALMQEKAGCEDPLYPSEVAQMMFNTGTSYIPAFPPCVVEPYPTNIDAFLAVDFIDVPDTFFCATQGDLNCDVFVDAHDFELFEHCLTGPGGSSQSGSCGCADCEPGRGSGDGDTDLADFSVFQQAFTGPPVGACCHIDGTCTEGTLQECSDGEGVYQGHTTDCATTECPPPPWGACCDVYTGECTIMAEDDCVWADGVYQGDGTDCETTVCPIVRYDNTIDPLTTYVSSPTGILADDATLDGAGGGYVRQYTVGLFAGYAGPFDATVSLHTGYPPQSGNLIQGTEFTYYNLPDNGSPVFVSPIVDPSVYIPHNVWIKLDLHGNQNAGWFRAEEAELGFTQDYYARYDPPWNYYWWGGPPNPWAGLWATITCDATRGGQSEGDGSVDPREPGEVLVAPPAQGLPEPIWRDAGTSHGRPYEADSHHLWEREGILHPAMAGPALAGAGMKAYSACGFTGETPVPQSGRGSSVLLELTSPVAGQVVQAGELVEWAVTATVSSSDNAGLALVCVDLSQDAGNPALFDLPSATVVGAGMEGFQRPAGIDNPEPGGTASAYGGTPVGAPGALNLVQIGGAQNTFGVEGDEIGVDINVDEGVGHVPQLIAQGSFYASTAEGTYVFTLESGMANVLDSNPPPSGHWPVTAASVTVGEPLTFTVGEVTCTPGDMNDDGTIDGKDIQPFVRVFLDPGGASPWESCAVDVDENEVLNQDDVVALVVAMVGVPNVTCTPGDVNDDGTIDGKDIQPLVGVFLDAGSASPRQFCAADIEEDGLLDSDDVSSFVAALLCVSVSCTRGDVNNDGVVDGKDIQPFIGVMFDPDSAMPQEHCATDCDDNDQVNVQDVAIFVGLLLGD